MAPFRWTIAKREQLGSLVTGDARGNLNRGGFLTNLREAAARILAFSDDADLAFIGRTPENFYDYVSGILSGVDDAPTLHLVHFSMRWSGEGGVRAMERERLSGFFDYLCEAGLDAASIATQSRPLALVDFIAHGGTMQNFVELLHLQAEMTGADWNAVQRRLRIIGLRVRTHNSPNTWRWQQHQDWLHLIPQAVIKNVSVPANFLWHIANDQPKVTHSFHPGLWSRDETHGKALSDDQLVALNLAVQLFDAGQERDEQMALASLIAKTSEMQQAATRRLVLRIKGL
jgi:hypothetical protein